MLWSSEYSAVRSQRIRRLTLIGYQRCMAASVLLLIGEQKELLKHIVEKAGALKPGSEAGFVGPVIDQPSKVRKHVYFNMEFFLTLPFRKKLLGTLTKQRKEVRKYCSMAEVGQQAKTEFLKKGTGLGQLWSFTRTRPTLLFTTRSLVQCSLSILAPPKRKLLKSKMPLPMATRLAFTQALVLLRSGSLRGMCSWWTTFFRFVS